jgi:hypothetical protein
MVAAVTMTVQLQDTDQGIVVVQQHHESSAG